ncbi:MAG: adenosylhomocysteinase [Solirubrobacteraceae bacterium]
MKSEIADPSLAPAGEEAIAWAADQMPVLAGIRDRLGRERPLGGVRLAACLHVTAETANLIAALAAGGAEVGLCACNPLSTRDDVAAALATRDGIDVLAVNGEDTASYYRHIEAVCRTRPAVTMDDGADLSSVLHAGPERQRARTIGGTESQASGAVRLRALEREGRLAYPIVALGRARTARLLDARYGTGQSTLDGIVRATNVLLAGRVLAVWGYGTTGRGIAERARGAGARVIVCEVDPVRALEARMDGHEVLPGAEAAAHADVLVTATGGRDAISAAHLDALRDGAILANAGHFDVEIDRGALTALASAVDTPRRHVERFTLPGGRRVILLAEGRVVNLAAAEGHPAGVMDLSFAIAALAVEHLVSRAGELTPGVLDVPDEIDRAAAGLRLAAMGVEIDDLTPAQRDYLLSWQEGT